MPLYDVEVLTHLNSTIRITAVDEEQAMTVAAAEAVNRMQLAGYEDDVALVDPQSAALVGGPEPEQLEHDDPMLGNEQRHAPG